jgi:hypothetical protein
MVVMVVMAVMEGNHQRVVRTPDFRSSALANLVVAVKVEVSG